MNLTQEAVDDAAARTTERDTAAVYLRSRGYSFGHAEFRLLWSTRSRPDKEDGLVERPDDAGAEAHPDKPLHGGVIVAPDVVRKKLQGRRFVVTCAQNNTKVHPQFWENLNAFCSRQGATLLVGRISYNKGAYGGVTREEADDGSGSRSEIWYDPVLEPFFIREQVKIAPRLVVCAELDIIPTAINPLGGLDDYTGPNSGIVPHTRLAMKSYATMKHEPTKFMYTTGAVTQRNYIDRRAGQLASFHHVYGALYIEVDEDGVAFVRQINASDDGSFYDLGTYYHELGWNTDQRVSVAVLGDIHIEKGDAVALGTTLEMIADLKPRHIMIHDIIDFTSRNHHNIKDPHFIAKMHFEKTETVEVCFLRAAKFIKTVQRISDACIYVIKSNHDEAYDKWVRDGAGFIDPPNARFWHESNAHVYQRIEAGLPLNVFDWALTKYLRKEEVNFDKLVLMNADESLVIHNIQYGMHGHLGPNGARGGARAFRQMGMRSTTGHSHSAGITDGNQTVGVLGKLDMGYNRGLSSWSHTNGITYDNGKRALLTLVGNRWRGKEL